MFNNSYELCAPLLLSPNFSSWWRVTFFSIFSCLIIFDYLLNIVLKRTAATWINITSPRMTHSLLLGKWGVDHFGQPGEGHLYPENSSKSTSTLKTEEEQSSSSPLPVSLFLLSSSSSDTFSDSNPWSDLDRGVWVPDPLLGHPRGPRLSCPHSHPTLACFPHPPHSRPPSSVNVAPDLSFFFPSHLFWVPHGHFQVLSSFPSSIYFFSIIGSTISIGLWRELLLLKG